MGMAVEGCVITGEHQVPLVQSSGVFRVRADEPKREADTPGLDPTETALILTCLSKGYSTSGKPNSDIDDMDELSDNDKDTLHRRQFSGVGKVHHVQQINFDGPRGSKLDFTDDAGFNHRFRHESNRVKSLVTKHISIDELRAHFDRPIIDVAEDFGICITLMKKICRRNGIKRWPHRQIRSLSKSIASMEAAMLSAHDSERDKYRDQIVNLKMKRESVIADPNKDNSMHHKISPPPSMFGDSAGQSMRASQHVISTLKLSPRPVRDAYASSPNGVPVVKIEEHLVVITRSTGVSKGGRWTSEEHAAFLEGIRLYGKDWRRVAQVVRTRSAVQTRTHAQKYLLKFAGRFPFETDGMLKDHPPVPFQMQCASADKLVRSMPSSTTSVSSSTAIQTRAGDDSMLNESWTSAEAQPLAKHRETMAMILNGSPQVAPLAPNVGAMAFPPLSMLKVEQSVPAAFQQPLNRARASYPYLSPQQDTP